MTEKNISFEKSLSELEKTAELLKSDDISLEDAIKAYEKGVALYEQCNDILTNAKQRIEVYSKESK